MTIDDIEWVLRYPCDEIELPQETLNKITKVIGESGRVAAGVQYLTSYDSNQRQVRTPDTLADRKLKIVPLSADNYDFDSITLRVRGIVKVCIVFPVA